MESKLSSYLLMVTSLVLTVGGHESMANTYRRITYGDLHPELNDPVYVRRMIDNDLRAWNQRDAQESRGSYSVTGCSAEIEEKAVSKVQEVLTQLSSSPEFASATKFQTAVREITEKTNPTEKLQECLSIVGVNSHDGEAILEFIGARDHTAYIETAKQKLELSHEQAATLVQRLRSPILQAIEN